jgi:uncharacterized protein (DUF305 family)
VNLKHSRAVAAVALVATTVLTLTACVMPFGMGGTSSMGDDGEQNAADVMFVQMMIPHHEQAIEMSEIILAKDGVDPEVAALAEQIRAAQDPEIVLMKQWLDDWGLPSMSGMGHGGMDHGGMDGMMSDAQMAELRSSIGSEGSSLFLELMIEHHEGAVDMADDVIDGGRNADVRELAEQIITSQTAEIETMRALLAR